MDSKQVLETYDEHYAAEYNEKFLLNERCRKAAEFEATLLRRLLASGGSWLDVACGTGYFLSLFPEVKRAGLDLSPAMLAIARRENSGVEFTQRDFRQEVPGWDGKWDVVSCMWYAYGLVESMNDVRRVIRNLGRWTAKGGSCLVPAADPDDLCRTTVPYLDPNLEFFGGRLLITGVTWTWIETSGKRHDDVVAPHIPYMVGMFQEHFDEVEVIDYPPAEPGWRPQKKAILARKR